MKYLLILLFFPIAASAQPGTSDTLITVKQLQNLTVKTTGTDAEGNTSIVALSGTKAITNTPLSANSIWNTGWLKRGQYVAAQTTIFSNRLGLYFVEYSDDSITHNLSMPSIPVAYAATGTRKGAFDISAEYVRFRYVNGPVAQDSFKMEIRFLTSAPSPSMESLNALGARTRQATWTKTRIETEDSTGNYDFVTRTGKSLNVNVTNALPVTITGPITTSPSGTQNVSVTNFPSTQAVTVSGTVTTTSNGTQNVSVSNFPSSQAVAVSNFPATQPISGTVTVSNPTTAVSVSNFPATQPVSIAATIPVSGTFWQTTQPVSGPITDAQIRATALPVSGTFFQATQPVSATVLPLPAGAATSANQITNNASIASVDGKITTTANGLKVDGSAVTQPVSLVTAPLATGAATSANQTSEIGSLNTIATNGATSALQTAGNASLTALASASGPATTGTFTAYSLAANTAQTLTAATRKTVKITSANGIILIGVGFTATATNYTYRIIANGTAELLNQDASLAISFFSTTTATANVSISN